MRNGVEGDFRREESQSFRTSLNDNNRPYEYENRLKYKQIAFFSRLSGLEVEQVKSIVSHGSRR